MASLDGLDWLSYNGEVYNYLELRDELAALGHSFHTGTDTEVILAAYRAWGTACFARFNGMWALALWDGRARRLVLSRDRLGVKPLFYAWAGDNLVFASEIKALLATERVSARLEPGVAFDYLKWSMVDHGETSFFAGIRSLPPGHFAVLAPGATELAAEPFWKLRAPQVALSITADEAAEGFARMFADAVRLRLRSDVPVGSCLSGGLDSSAIVCQADALRPSEAGPLHTFNAGARDPRFDERPWAELVNARVGAQAHFVYPEAAEFAADLDALLWHQEQPFTTASIYAQWRVMRAAREAGIPVLLDGQGADEALCGYRKFYLFYLRELARTAAFGRLAREAAGLARQGDRGLLLWREGARYLPAALRRGVVDLGRFLAPSAQGAWAESRLALRGGGSVPARQVADLTAYSVPSLLRYEDRNSMAWSIESRVPFLDYRLVEWLVALPTGIKLADGRTKAVMRQGLRGLVPDAILDRRDKMGFVTAQEVWMRGPLRRELEAGLANLAEPLARILPPGPLVAEFRRWVAGHSKMAYQDFFRVFILDRWLKRFDVHD